MMIPKAKSEAWTMHNTQVMRLPSGIFVMVHVGPDWEAKPLTVPDLVTGSLGMRKVNLFAYDASLELIEEHRRVAVETLLEHLGTLSKRPFKPADNAVFERARRIKLSEKRRI